LPGRRVGRRKSSRRIAPLDRVFPLQEIGAAHDYMERNLATGKIVVVP
jgi:NADPH:quinone reductase-like Zn-dependent oxidoreductase